MIFRSLSTRTCLNSDATGTSSSLHGETQLVKFRRSYSLTAERPPAFRSSSSIRLGRQKDHRRNGTYNSGSHSRASKYGLIPEEAQPQKSSSSTTRKRRSLRSIVKAIMGLLSARSSSSSILEAAPFGEVDNVMDLPDSYVHSDLELLETGRFSDFSIHCRSRTWRVHSLIVCSRSDWFDQGLNGESSESGKRVVTLSDCEPDDIDSMLLFLYSGGGLPDFSLTKWAKASNVYTAACHAFYLADKFSIDLLKRPALKQIAVQTKHRIPGDSWEHKFMEAVRLEYTGPNLPQRSLRQMFLLEAVRSRGRYRGPKFQGVFSDEKLAEENIPRFKEQVSKLEKVLLDNEGGDEHAVARMLRVKYTFVSEEASHARWLRDFPPQGRIV
ncbi:uncharacterized protein B0I36DRAFT_360263 [Microdochium trichocladiopsis]|uniref:BTB domain-containing protein n=1 Tax=Microdochium trichocladiopsis TaxID=1682393 RepID=A0A9P8YBF1_9PEZI|nr:uncharacterized protein B0I36DRAFT_360263 [Microdochium trichocladiopsis]KAH7034790.1 hypothetical protein B0I36DRAFT_360263 [Microdochium trichocladiopsis]